MARPASLDELISTKPKPRERPVSRSVTTVADSHVPISENSDSSSALVVEKDRFPTKIFLPMTFSCPCGATVVWSQLPEREAENAAGETGGGIPRKKHDGADHAPFSFLRHGLDRLPRT